jgi:uncharacterized protein YidB (DUF937 family)
MGLFDSLKEQAMGKIAELAAEHGPMAQHILELAQGKDGQSLSGLVQQFKDKGMGDIINSWISNGKNLPITAAQIQSVIGQERIQAIAAKFGIPADQASEKLAQFLPKIIDTLTPGGKLPDPTAKA